MGRVGQLQIVDALKQIVDALKQIVFSALCKYNQERLVLVN